MDLDLLHKHSINNKEELSRSTNCGCFSCCKIYPVSEIRWWIDGDKTAMCPYCDTDAVLGDACGVEISLELMEEMYKKYFEIDIDEEEYADDQFYDEDGDWDEDWDVEDEEWNDEEDEDLGKDLDDKEK